MASEQLLEEIVRLSEAGGRLDLRSMSSTCLDFSHSLMGDESASLLFSASLATAKLQGTPPPLALDVSHVTRLSLSRCSLGDSGVESACRLASLLCHSLRFLDLRGNPFGDAGCRSVASVIDGSAVRSLHTCGSGSSPASGSVRNVHGSHGSHGSHSKSSQGLLCLACAAGETAPAALEAVSIEDCPAVGDAGGEAIVAALRANGTILCAWVDGTGMGPAVRKKIANALETRRTVPFFSGVMPAQQIGGIDSVGGGGGGSKPPGHSRNSSRSSQGGGKPPVGARALGLGAVGVRNDKSVSSLDAETHARGSFGIILNDDDIEFGPGSEESGGGSGSAAEEESPSINPRAALQSPGRPRPLDAERRSLTPQSPGTPGKSPVKDIHRSRGKSGSTSEPPGKPVPLPNPKSPSSSKEEDGHHRTIAIKPRPLRSSTSSSKLTRGSRSSTSTSKMDMVAMLDMADVMDMLPMNDDESAEVTEALRSQGTARETRSISSGLESFIASAGEGTRHRAISIAEASPHAAPRSPAGRRQLTRAAPRRTQSNQESFGMGANRPAFREIDLSELSFDTLVGGGSFGKVYHGQWLGTEVAIKRLYYEAGNRASIFHGAGEDGKAMRDTGILGSDCSDDERANLLDEFYREVRVLANLRHPNIVLLMGACSAQGDLCIVTEYMEGGNLGEYIDKCGRGEGPGGTGLVPPDRVYSIARDIALGMNYLHSSFPIVVHRDLRSANIMVANDASVAKVGDFGLARTKVFRGMAQMSGGIGTPGYTAPEVLRGEMYSQTADVYSYAIVLLELASARRQFEDSEAGMRALRCLMDDQSWRPEIPRHVGEAWKTLIEMCWDPEPTERPSFKEVLEYLQEHAKELGKA